VADRAPARRLRRRQRRWPLGTVRVEGSGAAGDRSDLDLSLWTRRAEPLASAEGPGARHELRRPLEPGAYVVVVRDAGNGNRARFTLEARLEPR
jgi:hypothetical protein